MMRILIIEDSAADIRAYGVLFSPEREVSLLFLKRGGPENTEELRELVNVLSGSFPVKKYLLAEEKDFSETLKEYDYDFYISDSLGGIAPKILRSACIPKEKVAFFSSTTPFREIMKKEGYRAYRKEAISELIAECL